MLGSALEAGWPLGPLGVVLGVLGDQVKPATQHHRRRSGGDGGERHGIVVDSACSTAARESSARG